MNDHDVIKEAVEYPFHVEHFPIGSCVCNANGFNVLVFPSKPGAKFTSPEHAKSICDDMNSVRRSAT